MARSAAAVASVAFAASVVFVRMFRAEGLYLFLPVLACAVALIMPSGGEPRPAGARSPIVLAAVAAAVAGLPVACLLLPYVMQGTLGRSSTGRSSFRGSVSRMPAR